MYQILKKVAQINRKLYRAPQPRTFILCYHSIQPEGDFWSCRPETFEAHLQWLNENCTPVPLRDLLNREPAASPTGKPRVAVTFDDGYIDNFKHAYPLLDKWEVPATFFLTVGFMEKDPEVMERIYSLRQIDTKEVEPMTWGQVREMLNAGLSFGAHTYSHPNLRYVEKSRLDFELKQPKAHLEEKLGQPVDGFAYPFGKPRFHFDAPHVERVRDAGYTHAAAVIFRGMLPQDSPWVMPRFCINDADVETLAAKAYGAWDFVGYINQWSPRWIDRILAPDAY